MVANRDIVLPALHAAQEQVYAERSRFNCVECGRRWGKSMLGLVAACETAIAGWPVGLFSPSYKYYDEAWGAVHRLIEPAITKSSEQKGRIELVTGGVIDLWSCHNAKDPGRGRQYKLVIFDEAAFITNLREIWTAAVRPTLTDLKGTAWFMSTPHGREFFHELWERGQSGDDSWMSWRMGTVTNPHIDQDEIEEARREFIETASEAVFEQEYLGIPAPDGGNPFGLDHIEACIEAGLAVDARPRAWGIDLAKSHDWTVCIGLSDDGRTSNFDRWQLPWGETKNKIANLVGSASAYADATGVGDAIVESLMREYHCQGVEPFVFTNQSKQRLMEGLAQAIQSRSITFPDGDIRRELETFRYELRPGGKVFYSAPEGLHDDCVCALALAVECLRQQVPVRAHVLKSGPRPDPEMQQQEGEDVRAMFERRRRDPNFGFQGARRW